MKPRKQSTPRRIPLTPGTPTGKGFGECVVCGKRTHWVMGHRHDARHVCLRCNDRPDVRAPDGMDLAEVYRK